jgi:flavin-dependent dehydrogenase
MEEYDVIVVGGGIAGSVAARFSAEHGFKTLLLEKYKTPETNPVREYNLPILRNC